MKHAGEILQSLLNADDNLTVYSRVIGTVVGEEFGEVCGIALRAKKTNSSIIGRNMLATFSVNDDSRSH